MPPPPTPRPFGLAASTKAMPSAGWLLPVKRNWKVVEKVALAPSCTALLL